MDAHQLKTFETLDHFLAWRKEIPSTKNIGFVPTMGALHAGHASLLHQARTENDFVVLSIFVNPTQFNQKSDFETYPKPFREDLELAHVEKVDAVFAPSDPKFIYPDDFRYRVTETVFSKTLCGEFRPGHFDGVLTLVLKFFNIVRPTRAYFGEKDHQQLSLISGMIDALFLDIKLVPCKTMREDSGLALSSRNKRLSTQDLKLAPKLYEIITQEKNLETAIQALTQAGFKVEYLKDQHEKNQTRRYVAAWLGEVRLIDNVIP